MSIQGLGGIYGQQGIIPGARPLGGEPEEAESTAGRAAGRGAEEVGGAPRATQELPAKAPPGTDPNLWNVLTAEERSYFSRVQTMGPLTYSRSTGTGAEAAVQRGSRIDVRV